ncbi:MAG TPA: DUF6188 family protein [Pirellula sp.]|nr:DUF6188 family protein [Pirellula sp.]
MIINPMPISYDTIDVSWTIGRVIADVSFDSPSFWRFSLGSPESIAVECLWRIVRAGRIVLTSQDHGHSFGLSAPVDAARNAMEALLGVRVTNAQIREATADLHITLGSGMSLEIIPDSSGYESWQLYAPTGRCYIAQGGGQICTWTQ